MGDMYLNRKIFTNESTVGKLVFKNSSFWTLEDTMRQRDLNQDGKLQKNEKVYGRTAIPAGTYEVFIRDSTRFKRPMPYLKNVPFFEDVMIHSGNFPGDTLGCILIGMRHVASDSVYESKKAFGVLFPMIEEDIKTNTASPLRIHIAGGYSKEEFADYKMSLL